MTNGSFPGDMLKGNFKNLVFLPFDQRDILAAISPFAYLQILVLHDELPLIEEIVR